MWYCQKCADWYDNTVSILKHFQNAHPNSKSPENSDMTSTPETSTGNPKLSVLKPAGTESPEKKDTADIKMNGIIKLKAKNSDAAVPKVKSLSNDIKKTTINTVKGKVMQTVEKATSDTCAVKQDFKMVQVSKANQNIIRNIITQGLGKNGVVGSIRTYICKFCCRRYPNDKALTNHVKTHTEAKHECYICKFEATTFSTLMSHFVRHTGSDAISGVDVLNKAVVQGKDCSAAPLEQKNKVIVQKVPVPPCTKVQVKTKGTVTVNTTCKNLSSEEKVQSSTTKVPSSPNAINKLSTPEKEKIIALLSQRNSCITCSHCNKFFYNKEKFNAHYCPVLNKKTEYICAYCRKVTYTVEDYRDHIQSHAMTSYVCGHCSTKFPHKLQLKRHFLTCSKRSTDRPSNSTSKIPKKVIRDEPFKYTDRNIIKLKRSCTEQQALVKKTKIENEKDKDIKTENDLKESGIKAENDVKCQSIKVENDNAEVGGMKDSSVKLENVKEENAGEITNAENSKIDETCTSKILKDEFNSETPVKRTRSAVHGTRSRSKKVQQKLSETNKQAEGEQKAKSCTSVDKTIRTRSQSGASATSTPLTSINSGQEPKIRRSARLVNRKTSFSKTSVTCEIQTENMEDESMELSPSAPMTTPSSPITAPSASITTPSSPITTPASPITTPLPVTSPLPLPLPITPSPTLSPIMTPSSPPASTQACDIITDVASPPPPAKVNKSPVKKSTPIKQEPQQLSCNSCSQKFQSRASLRRHKRMHSWKPQFVCHYCGKFFSRRNIRLNHELRIHQDTFKTAPCCCYCDTPFESSSLLLEHVNTNHFSKVLLTGRRRLSNKMVAKTMKEMLHTATESKEKAIAVKSDDKSADVNSKTLTYRCGTCNITFKETTSLLNHFSDIHGVTDMVKVNALKTLSDGSIKRQFSTLNGNSKGQPGISPHSIKLTFSAKNDPAMQKQHMLLSTPVSKVSSERCKLCWREKSHCKDGSLHKAVDWYQCLVCAVYGSKAEMQEHMLSHMYKIGTFIVNSEDDILDGTTPDLPPFFDINRCDGMMAENDGDIPSEISPSSQTVKPGISHYTCSLIQQLTCDKCYAVIVDADILLNHPCSEKSGYYTCFVEGCNFSTISVTEIKAHLDECHCRRVYNDHKIKSKSVDNSHEESNTTALVTFNVTETQDVVIEPDINILSGIFSAELKTLTEMLKGK